MIGAVRLRRRRGSDHAIELLGKREDAQLLAGGRSLIPAMKLRLARPALLIDVGRIADLYVQERPTRSRSGADPAQGRGRVVRASQHCPIVSSTAVESATRRCVTAGRSEGRLRTAIRRRISRA